MSTVKDPLKAYGANGEIIAYSYDGGKQWGQVVPKGKKKEPTREYTRKIAAIMPDNATPSWHRRIGNSFAPLNNLNILAGWGPIAHILSLEPESLDAIVIPYGSIDTSIEPIETTIKALRQIAKVIFMDIDTNIIKDRSQYDDMINAVRLVDGLLVPTDLIAMGFRKFNANTFTVPPTVEINFWKGAHREPNTGPIRIAVQPTSDQWVANSMIWAKDRWGDKITIIEDLWEERFPNEDPDFYLNVDVVVVGAPEMKNQTSNASLLAPMTAGCMILCDGAYNRTINHGHSGSIVAGRGPSPWRRELTHAITDNRTRMKMQAGARKRAESYINRSLLAQLAIPYRVMIPE